MAIVTREYIPDARLHSSRMELLIGFVPGRNGRECDVSDVAIDDDRLIDSTVECFLHGLEPVVPAANAAAR